MRTLMMVVTMMIKMRVVKVLGVGGVRAAGNGANTIKRLDLNTQLLVFAKTRFCAEHVSKNVKM